MILKTAFLDFVLKHRLFEDNLLTAFPNLFCETSRFKITSRDTSRSLTILTTILP